MEEIIICSKCGEIIEDDDYSTVNRQIVCSDCISRYHFKSKSVKTT